MNKFLRLSLFLFVLTAILTTETSFAMNPEQTTCSQAIIHYRRRNADYLSWGLHVWGPVVNPTEWTAPISPAGEDEFGIFWVVDMQENAENLNYIIHNGDSKDPGPDQVLRFNEFGCEIWQVQENKEAFSDPQAAIASMQVQVSDAPDLNEDQVIIHYRRTTEDYDGWGLHVWGPTTEENITWTSPLLPAGQDDYGIYWVIRMEPGAESVNYIVHKGDTKDPGPDQQLVFTDKGREVWLIEGSGEQFMDSETAKQGILIAGIGDIVNKAQAHWVDETTIAWPIEYGDKAIYRLHYDPDGEIQVTEDGLQGGSFIELQFIDDNLSPDYHDKYPHLSTAIQLEIPEEHRSLIPEMLKGQLAISVSLMTGEILNATGIQIAGVLDALYSTDLPLGVNYKDNEIEISVWAPTAKTVNLLLYPDSNVSSDAEIIPMVFNEGTGIWSATGTNEWDRNYYLFEVEVYVRQEHSVVTNLVTDPYSVSLSQNSLRSQIVNLTDADLAPPQWSTLAKPPLENFSDIVIYELHLRDFSILDSSVPESLRGTYLAFTETNSDGMSHLIQLANAGLTHIHLLPIFDIATIDEDKSTWQTVDREALTGLPPDSAQQQEAVNRIRNSDGYNWGYDPYHYGVPEGSYSTNPDSESRIIEFRSMVQSLNQAGLRVVMDVVYNHTNASGQAQKSVLDRIVPGYYHRLDENGNVTSSTCCSNTATEHDMMRRLMIDTLVHWARDYKVDGFRFDLMGHHMVTDMLEVQGALQVLTIKNDGVDGSEIYIYGEGWDFGEVENNARGINATQLNLAGTGIGTFNDRFRDAVRGGSPFSAKPDQGFSTGQFYFPNNNNSMSPDSRLTALLAQKDQIRIGLAGNLSAYQFVDANDKLILGSEILYNGDPAGYTNNPLENIIYVSAHDNETLFDAIQYKLPAEANMEQRIRAQNLSLSLTMLGQGIPFFHAGSEILRSKSMERDSYDSGDWFNAIDWTYQSNNWGIGLPLQDKNGNDWSLIEQIVNYPNIQVEPNHLLRSMDHFLEMLRIRKSSPLFRLSDAESIINQVQFHNTGSNQIPGLIAMSISDDPDHRVDNLYDFIFILFNADIQSVEYEIPPDLPAGLELHPVLRQSSDALIHTLDIDPEGGKFFIPSQTTLVFVHPNPSGISEVTPQVTSSTDRQPGQVAQEIEEQPADGASSLAGWIVPGIIAFLVLTTMLVVFMLRRTEYWNT